MNEIYVYVAAIGVICILNLKYIWAAFKFVWTRFSSKALPQSLDDGVDHMDKWTRYAAARANIMGLRIVDFEQANLDISAELNAIESKLAASLKASNTQTPTQTV